MLLTATDRRVCKVDYFHHRRANLLRRPPHCARRDGQPRLHSGGHRARRSRLGDVQQRHQQQIERLRRPGEFHRPLHAHEFA